MENVTDLTLNRSITYQIASYESIRPGTSITVKNVNVSSLPRVYDLLDNLISDIFKIEVARHVNHYYDFGNDLKETLNEVIDNYDQLLKSIKDNSENLDIELGG